MRQQSEIRNVPAKEAAAFLDEAKGVDQRHFRNALANALERIDKLERMVFSRDRIDELEEPLFAG
jgi:hypothetical protein